MPCSLEMILHSTSIENMIGMVPKERKHAAYKMQAALKNP